MPLDPTDPSYRSEVVPSAIDVLGRGLCAAYSVGPAAFGGKGNLFHYSGYHRSRRWILHSSDSAYGSRDYSVQQSLDKSGDENWVSAFDFTPGVWGSSDNRAKMRELTGRVLAAAKARDPRLSDLREFAGTIDGKNVITFNCADGSLKGAFDASHLDHVHGSLWRSRAANDHSGLLEVMLGDDMPDWFRQEDWDNLRWRQYATEISPEFDANGVAHVQGGPAKGQEAWQPTFLKELGDAVAKLGEQVTLLTAKVDAIEAGGGLSDADRAALQANTDAVTALNSRLATP